MLNRVRINEGVSRIPKYSEKSSLYTIFNDEFNFFTRTLSSAYVPRPELEKRIRENVIDTRTGFFFVEGFTGSGKTTLMQNVLCNTKNKPLPSNVLRIYFSLNPADIPSLERFITRFTSQIIEDVSTFVMKLPSDKQRHLSDPKNLYNFITGHKRFGELQYDKLFPHPKEILDSAIDELLNNNITQLYPILVILWLEYVLITVDDNIRCVITVDDIEGVSCALQPEIFNYYISAYAEMATSSASNGNYSVAAFFPIRPDTLYHFMHSDKVPKIDAFSPCRIPVSEPPSLLKIFLARFNEIQGILLSKGEKQESRQNKEHYKRAYENILIPLLERIENYNKQSPDADGPDADVLLELSNYNIRAALDLVRAILVNGDFFEKKDYDNQISGASGTVSLDKFFPTDVGILFSIAVSPGLVYIGKPPVSNILHNTKDENCDLLAILILRFMLQISKEDPFMTISLASIQSQFKAVLPDKYTDSEIISMFEFLRDNDLLLSTYDDGDKDTVILAPRAKMLWILASKTAVLMQCYREDLYRSRELSFLEKYFMEPRRTHFLARDILYLDILSLLEYYLDIEIDMIIDVNNNNRLKMYYSTFGGELTARRLFKGVESSCKKYFQKSLPDSRFIVLYQTLEARIANLSSELPKP